MQPWGVENPQPYSWFWLGKTLQCLLVAFGAHRAQHPRCLDDGGIWGTWCQNVLAHAGSGVCNPWVIAQRLAEEGHMCVEVC